MKYTISEHNQGGRSSLLSIRTAISNDLTLGDRAKSGYEHSAKHAKQTLRLDTIARLLPEKVYKKRFNSIQFSCDGI